MKFSTILLAVGVGVWAQAPSTFRVSGKAGEEAIEIRNISYEVSGPEGNLLALRKTEQTRRVVGDKGMEATTTLEVWPLRADQRQKPLYTLKVAGVDGRTMDSALFVVTRGLEDVEWWSVYRLTDGKPMFDTHVRMVRFSTSNDVQTVRYAGFEVPPDGDARLKDETLIGVLHYAMADRELRQVEFRCADKNRARLLRSYWDVQRTFEFAAGRKALVLKITESQPDIAIEIPLEGEDLAVGKAKLPAGIRATAVRPK